MLYCEKQGNSIKNGCSNNCPFSLVDRKVEENPSCCINCPNLYSCQHICSIVMGVLNTGFRFK